MSRFLRFRSKTKRRPPTDLSLRYLIRKNGKILWCKIMTAEILYESTAEASIKREGLIENGDAINRLYIFV